MYINESFILEKNDLYINFDKFKSGEYNICLITGLSGSGKSTLGKEIAKKYKAEYVELDKFFIFNKKEDLQNLSKTFDKYFKDNEDIYDSILNMEKRDDPTTPLLLLTNLINYCKTFKNKKFILEGVQIYLFADESIKNYPIIIKNTPALKSMFRMFKRDFIEFDGLKYHQCIKYIPKFLKIYIEDEKDFNVFKKKFFKGGKKNMNLLESDLNSIVIFSTDILPTSVCEEYLATKMDIDKFNTTNAVERYLVIELSQLIKQSKLDKMIVNDIIDRRFKEIMYNRQDEIERSILFSIKEIKQIDLTYDTLEAVLNNSIFNPNSLLYMKTLLNSNGDSSNADYLNISLSTQSFLKTMELIKYLAMKLDVSDSRFRLIYSQIQEVLYDFKDFYSDSANYNLGISDEVVKDNLVMNPDTITEDEIYDIFDKLGGFLMNQVDSKLYYMINEFKCLSYRMEVRQQEKNTHTEAFDLENKYNDAISKFENMDLLNSEGDLDIMKVVEAYQLAHDICKYQYMQEASTTIITKGTNKITKAIGNASAKSRGMANAKSKVGAIKRGARIIDDRASDAVNKKIDDIMNFSRDAKREKILTGKNTVRVGQSLKNAIKIIVGGAAGLAAFGPLAGAIIGFIGILGARGISKNVEDREKKRILLELETELKIVKEKVEDSKAENNKKQKYQLMRIQANLEKEITRIKHGLRYY